MLARGSMADVYTVYVGIPFFTYPLTRALMVFMVFHLHNWDVEPRLATMEAIYMAFEIVVLAFGGGVLLLKVIAK